MDPLSQLEQTQEDQQAQADPAPVSTTDGSLTHGPKLELIDWSIRLLACALAVIALTAQLLAQTPHKEGTLSLIILAAPFGMYLLGSIEPVARRLYSLAQSTPVAMAILPLFLLIPYAVLGRRTAQVDISDMLTAGMLLFLPTTLALVNSSRARWADVSLGLVAVAMPLVAPLLRSETLTGADTVLRIGAFVLPVVLLALSTRQQKERLNFLFLCAVLALWYSIEFNAFPSFSLPGFSLPGLSLLGQSTDMSYFHLVAICTLLYVLAIAGRFGGLGLSFKPSAHGLSTVASNLAIFTLIAVCGRSPSTSRLHCPRRYCSAGHYSHIWMTRCACRRHRQSLYRRCSLAHLI